jgi:hypothetical protein
MLKLRPRRRRLNCPVTQNHNANQLAKLHALNRITDTEFIEQLNGLRLQ